MSARILFEVALRVLGVWLFFSAVSSLTSLVSFYLTNVPGLSPGMLSYNMMSYFVTSTASFFMELLMSGALIFAAPRIAARFYPRKAEDQELRVAVGPGDVYRTACFVLGAYFLVRTAEPAGRLVGAGLSGRVFFQASQLADALTAMVYVASGILLVFGSRKISQLLSNLRYDPDTIPAQRFSLAVLMILLFLCAIVLGVIRFMAQGGMM
jgi:hypothetical protein